MPNKRTLIISYCDRCPFYDDYYEPVCKMADSNAGIPSGIDKDRYMHPIPDWCPLEDVTEVER